MQFFRLIVLGGVLLTTAPLTAQQAPPAPKVEAKPRPEHRPPKIDISKLKFISGCWQGRLGEDTEVEEIWTTPSDNLFLATTRIFKKEYAISYEFSRIQVTDSGLVFAASSDGKPENVYALKTLVDEYVVFENAGKEFPQRIIYRLASDGALIPRNEGDGPSVELRFHRVKCPGADIKLKP
jgi:hypothetical protein